MMWQFVRSSRILSQRVSLGLLGLSVAAAGAGLAASVLCSSPMTAVAEETRPATATPPATIQYNRDVRPILAEYCFACHGPDSASRKAGLRLDHFKDATADREGSFAIKPGDVAASEVVHRWNSTDPESIMPPPETTKVLSAEQKAILERWIASGAEYEPHWSYIPPQRPELPAVRDTAWVRDPIDRFVLAELEANHLTPAEEADRRTLVRRVSYDLTGLPPDPELVQQFVSDTSPRAYELLVDELMATPQWGEHRARYWLDAARFADTHGIHFDNYREIWAYRDWVINAFNQNQPFDQFSIEQLAGDLLPNRTLDQQVATGFHRCNMTTNEGGVIPEEYAVLYTRDRTETTAQVWMGLTAGCSVCHDHKFDPISQREFYEMAAFFNNTTQNTMDGNIKDTPPTVPVALPEDRGREQAVKSEIAELTAKVAERRGAATAEFAAWLAQQGAGSPSVAVVPAGLEFHAPLADGASPTVHAFAKNPANPNDTTLQPVDATLPHPAATIPGHLATNAFLSEPGKTVVEFPAAGNFGPQQAFTVSIWAKITPGTPTGAIVARMNDSDGTYRGWELSYEGDRLSCHLIHTWPENAIKAVSRVPVPINDWHHYSLTYDGSGSGAGVSLLVDGQPLPIDFHRNSLKDTIQTDVPTKLAQRHVSSPLANVGLQDLRLFARALPPAEISQLVASSRAEYLAKSGAAAQPGPARDELYQYWLKAIDPASTRMQGELAAREQELKNILARGTIAHVMQEKNEEAMAFVLYRGEYDQRRDPVKPDTFDVLPAFPESLPRNRLGLARWLFLDSQPLTARVAVNRIWQELFGQGLVRTAGDFGISGELASNQPLLDWMAIELRDSHWDLKRFYKLVVMSATYRQAAITTPEKLAKDPTNRLLSRGPRFRMDAEMVRDSALAFSGLLNRKIGGPSVRPYQPEGVWEAVAMPESNTRNYQRDKGDSLYRRSMYTFWKRAAPPASMEIFNAPNRELCSVRRERTNTPLQALVTLNDPQFVEAARVTAQRMLLRSFPTETARLNDLAVRLIARPFTPAELAIAHASLADLQAFYTASPEEAEHLLQVGEAPRANELPAPAVAAWTMLINELMNLDEVLNK